MVSHLRLALPQQRAKLDRLLTQVNCRITSIAHPRNAGAISSVRSVHHWATPPLTARRVGLRGLKQLSEVRLAHPLMLRQALKLVQHLCVHPETSAVGSDKSAA